MTGARAAFALLAGGLIGALMFASFQWGRASMTADIARSSAAAAASAVADDVKTYQREGERRLVLAEEEAMLSRFLERLPEPPQEVTYVTEMPADCPLPRWSSGIVRDNRRAINARLSGDGNSILPGPESGPDDGPAAAAGPARDHDPGGRSVDHQ